MEIKSQTRNGFPARHSCFMLASSLAGRFEATAAQPSRSSDKRGSQANLLAEAALDWLAAARATWRIPNRSRQYDEECTMRAKPAQVKLLHQWVVGGENRAIELEESSRQGKNFAVARLEGNGTLPMRG